MLCFALLCSAVLVLVLLLTIQRTPQQVSDRLDELITEMKCVIEARSSGWPLGQDADQQRNTQAQDKAQDIVCVAHGHVLAAMALRWVGLPLGASATRMIFEPAGVAALG